jgi:hypothetical protein
LHCFAAKIFNRSRRLILKTERRSISKPASPDRKASGGKKKEKSIQFPQTQNQMARVQSTARVERAGDEAEGSETIPISEAMQRSGLVTAEEMPAAEADPTTAEGEEENIEETDPEDDYHIAMPSKPSHLDFGKSTVSKADLTKMVKSGFFTENQRKLLRFGGEETTPKPEKDEIIIFKSFLKAGLRFPLHGIIADILQKFGIHFHQLTPNAIVRLNVYIWALRSQGVEPFADSFCRVHELHYQTKARKDGLHENFGCYNFAYRKTTKSPVISYRSKWPAGWKSEWFYVKVDDDKEKLVQSPLELIFGETRPRCNMTPEGPTQQAINEFRIIAEHIGTRDLVQEFLAFKVFPSLREWEMPKLKGEKKEGELVRLPYHFKFKKYFKAPCQEWLDTIEMMCNEILGNYSKKEDQLMTAAFGTRPKRRLNRVLDAVGFDYPDYDNLNKNAGGQKRKRATEGSNKDEEETPKKKIPRKKKTTSPKQQKISDEEKSPASPSADDVEEILKVMTEPLPPKLSPLGPQLTKLFRKVEEPEKTKITKTKRQRIIAVTEVIDKTPPRAPTRKTPAIEGTTNVEVAPSEIAATEATSAEDVNLETTIGNIDKILLDMAAEEAAITAEETTATVPGKEKEIAEDTSDDEAYSFQNLIGQKLSKAEIEELKEYAKHCGYKPGALLFGGIDDEKLGCIRDPIGAKVIGTLSKSIGFPKLETDISRYRRQHIVGSLFYSNFKVNNFSLTSIVF